MFIRRSESSGREKRVAIPKIASPAVLRDWVETLSVPRHFFRESGENRRIALWLHDTLKSWGYDVGFHGQSRNVIAAPPDLSGPALLIGAHYDSVPGCPGADDNASAVATMLAVALACGARVPVVFAAFNREEDGLIGSREFVAETLPTLPWSVRAAHILEMVGYATNSPGSQRIPDGLPKLPITLPTVGNFLGLLANGNSVAFLRDAVAMARGSLSALPVVGLEVRLGLERFLPVLKRSDHVPFWEKKIPAMMWTDTAEFRNPHYHLASDTADTLNYDFLHTVSALCAACALRG